jgi:hypothetical protein
MVERLDAPEEVLRQRHGAEPTFAQAPRKLGQALKVQRLLGHVERTSQVSCEAVPAACT